MHLHRRSQHNQFRRARDQVLREQGIVSIEEAVLLDDVPRTLAHVENDLSRDGLVDADAGEACGEALCCEAVGAVGTFEVAPQSSNADFVESSWEPGWYLSWGTQMAVSSVARVIVIRAVPRVRM